MTRRLSSLLLVGAGLLAAGCRSTERLEVHRLPLHVMIIPIAAPTIGQTTPGEHEGDETEIRLDIDCDEVTRIVAGALEEYCFSRVTLIEPHAGGADEAVDGFERERAFLDRARELEADLILELGLRYDPEVYRKNAGTFWLNYPLFLFAGPSNWFVPDNVYQADVELTANVYDLHAIGAGGGALTDPAAEVISVSSRFAGTELTYTERSTGTWDYAKGIVIPSGFLGRQSGDAGEAIHEDIVEALRTQVVQAVQSRRDDLVRTDAIAPIFLEPGDVSIARHGDDLHVQGRIRLSQDSLARRVRAVHIDAGAERVTVEPSVQPRDDAAGYSVFHFDVPVAVATDARYLRLECEAGSRDKYVRSYTFRIPPEEESRP